MLAIPWRRVNIVMVICIWPITCVVCECHLCDRSLIALLEHGGVDVILALSLHLVEQLISVLWRLQCMGGCVVCTSWGC